MSVGAVQLLFIALGMSQVGVGVGVRCHGACCAGCQQSPQLPVVACCVARFISFAAVCESGWDA
jgi:hypothetical protein